VVPVFCSRFGDCDFLKRRSKELIFLKLAAFFLRLNFELVESILSELNFERQRLVRRSLIAAKDSCPGLQATNFYLESLNSPNFQRVFSSDAAKHYSKLLAPIFYCPSKTLVLVRRKATFYG
jgi:hypothetical protein